MGAIKDGELASADVVLNNCVGTPFRNFSNLLWNSARIGFNSKLNVATGVPNLKNVKYDIFGSDSASYWENMEYYSTDKLYRTMDISAATDYYVDIYCTSISDVSTLNNCVFKCMKKTSTQQVWRLYCTTGTAAVKRSQILKTLFYGSDGSNPRASLITGCTALKTSDSNDVGMKFRYIKWSPNCNSNDASSYTNVYSASWSDVSSNKVINQGYVYATANGANAGNNSSRLEIPTSTIVLSATNLGTGSATTDTTGLDNTATDKTNPATITLTALHASSGTSHTSSHKFKIVIGWKSGTLGSWTQNISGGSWSDAVSFNDNDFSSSIPAMTLIDYSTTADSSLTFANTSLPTILDCIATWNASIDTDNTLAVSISSDGTNYETVTDATIHRFTHTGANLYVKFAITRVDTAAVDKISEYAILYNLGAS